MKIDKMRGQDQMKSGEHRDHGTVAPFFLGENYGISVK
jgi:hypothetical protein